MAEQEACASAVTEALAAAGESPETAEGGDPRGESLLLPLLQGLLGGGGERLLAGLGSAGADVVADVRRSLARLRAALAPPTDHPQARALLSLADRLEDALDAADRLDGCKKKPRRRSRTARHTVGVTHEELAQARRLVDRDHLALAPESAEPPAPSTPPSGAASSTSAAPSEPTTPERKQSLDTADEEVSYHDAVAARHKPPPIAHSVSYESAPIVNREARVVERREPTSRKPDFYRHSMGDPIPQFPQSQQAQAPPPAPSQSSQMRMDRRPSDSRSGITKLANKFNAQIEKEMPNSAPIRRPTKISHQASIVAPTVQEKPSPKEDLNRPPLYRPLPPSFNFAAPQAADDFSKPLNRFANNKRNRMKRANTINIGEPLGGYRLDSDTDDENLDPMRGPNVPKFQPQTDNDRKFLAFMQKNEENQRGVVNGHSNWSNRFGNIKNTFENREREDHSRSSSASSAKRFWQVSEETPAMPPVRLPRKSFGEINVPRTNAPWSSERRDVPQTQYMAQNHPPPIHSTHVPTTYPPLSHSYPPVPQSQPPVQQSPVPHSYPPVSEPHPPAQHSHPPVPHSYPPVSQPHPPAQHPHPPVPHSYPPVPQSQHSHPPAPHTYPPVPHSHPSVPTSPTKPLVMKPFVAKPIPVNQFSHAPMSAFKPLKKVMSPTSVPTQPHVWSPPSANCMVSPTTENPPDYMISPKPIAPSPPVASAPWTAAEIEKPKRVLSIAASKFEGNRFNSRIAPPPVAPPSQRAYNPPQPTAYPSYTTQNYAVKSIPSQNNLSAPELVKKIDNQKQHEFPEKFPSKIDAEKLQIEFYEKQIRDKHRREPVSNGYQNGAGHRPSALPTHTANAPHLTYTVTDYTPVNIVSTFVPLQQTPDIEKAKAHKVDYLPDVVMNENNHHNTNHSGASPTTNKHPGRPRSPRNRRPPAAQNGDYGDSEATEHSSVTTRVMRGPVCGNATITAGVRTRASDQPRVPSLAAAKNLKGVLEKFSSPKHDVIAQIEKKKRQTTNQVRPEATPPVQNGHPPPPARVTSPRSHPPVIKYESVPLSPAGSPRSPAIGASRESIFSSESAASRGSSPASNALSKSESWHQIIERSGKPTSPRRMVSRTKSMHLLSVPKMFEGGIARDELTEKKRTVEAYFTGRASQGAKSPRVASIKAKASRSTAQTQSFSLGRSRTMPSVSEMQFLDESNADDAFEDLVSALA